MLEFTRTVLKLTRPYRGRLILGILCGFMSGLSNPLLMGSIKLVFEVVFPQAGAPTLAERLQGFSLLSASDVQDLPRFVRTLSSGADPVSQALWAAFSDGGRHLLSDRSATAPQQQTVLVEELNRIVRGPSLYQLQRFDGVRLRSATQALLAANPDGAERVRLNIHLLEDAYPGVIQTETSRRLPRFLQRWLHALSEPIRRLGENRRR